MTIKRKIIFALLTVFSFSLIIGAYGIYSVNFVLNQVESQRVFISDTDDVYDTLLNFYEWHREVTHSIIANIEFADSVSVDTCPIDLWRRSEGATERASDRVLELLPEFDEPHNILHENVETAMRYVSEGRQDEAMSLYLTDIKPMFDTVFALFTEIALEYDYAVYDKTTIIAESVELQPFFIALMIIIASVIGLIFGIIIIRSILKPIKRLVYAAENIVVGNLNVNIDTSSND